MNHNPAIPVVKFYKTPPMPCPYIDGKQEQLIFTRLDRTHGDALHDVLAGAGFRRSHGIVYRPECEGCAACVPVRVRAREFRMRRSLRRVASRNGGVSSAVVESVATAEHFNLFARYQDSRHGDGSMASMDFEDYRAMVEQSPVATMLVEYRDGDGGLFGAALTDRLNDGLSMVYSFFEPDKLQRSPGTFIIVEHVRLALSLGLGYLYLGYWIAGSAKMAYKERFRPLEILDRSGWHLAEPLVVRTS
jgi:arginine-tRNA-protein transferase